jgi:hypothetical protein
MDMLKVKEAFFAYFNPYFPENALGDRERA